MNSKGSGGRSRRPETNSRGGEMRHDGGSRTKRDSKPASSSAAGEGSRSAAPAGSGSKTSRGGRGGLAKDKPITRGKDLDDRSHWKQRRDEGGGRGSRTNESSYKPERSRSHSGPTSGIGTGFPGKEAARHNSSGSSYGGGRDRDNDFHGYGHYGSSRHPRSSDKRQPVLDMRGFTDDSRLAKAMRRIIREEDRDRRLSALKTLREVIDLPESEKLILKNTENTLEVLHASIMDRSSRVNRNLASSCLGMVGIVICERSQRYFQWMFGKLNTAKVDEERVLLLKALHQTLTGGTNRHMLDENMLMVMSHCQSILENADVPELLQAVVEVILEVIKVAPHTFNQYFRDTVDILVGWHIDPTQKATLTAFTSDTLIALHPYWVADLPFSTTLLSQFIEDMEAYVEDFSLVTSGQTGSEDDVPTADECVVKIAALLRVFSTVMQSLGEYSTPQHNPNLTTNYMVEMVERITKCITTTMASIYSDEIYAEANACLEVVVVSLGQEAVESCEVLLPFLAHQHHLGNMPEERVLLTLLTLTYKVIELVGVQLPEVFIGDLFGEGSVLLKLRFSENKQILGGLMEVYRSVMSLKSVPILVEAYRYIVGDMENALSELLKQAEAEPFHLIDNSPFKKLVYQCREAELAIIFNLCALGEIDNTKNNLIGIWALSPSLFSLLCDHLLPACQDIMQRYPAIHYAMLNALYIHCNRHGQFVSNSNLLAENPMREGTILANVNSTTSGHLAAVMELVASLLHHPDTPHDSSCLLLKWVHTIIGTLQNSKSAYARREFQAIIQTLVENGHSKHPTICLLSCRCLYDLVLHSKQLDSTQLCDIAHLCLMRLQDTNTEISNKFFDLFKSIPLTTTTSMWINLSRINVVKHNEVGYIPADVARTRRLHMSSPPAGTFHTHNFRMIMAYLLHNTPPSESDNADWLERLFYTSQRLDQDNKETAAKVCHLMNGDNANLWFWATWESAQFCVLAKLRTILGKPLDTFTAIEAPIRKLAMEASNHEADTYTKKKKVPTATLR